MNLRLLSPVRRLAACVAAALAIAALPAVQLAAAPGAAAAPAHSHSHSHAYVPQAKPRSGSPMQYGGGPVQTNPVVYLDFWGSQWHSDGNGVQQYLTNLFNGLGTSQDNWSTITSQYTDYTGTGSSFNGPVLGGTWVDDATPAPAAAAQSDIAAEADNAAGYFGVAGNPNVQIVVLSPHGTSPDGWPGSGFCAWHDYTGSVSYTNMPYQLDAPVGSRCPNSALGGKLDAFSIVEGHEYAESISDPQAGNGWVNALGQEIGDVCESNFQKVTLPTGTFAMQPIWSNAAGGCVISG
jgi:serine protease